MTSHTRTQLVTSSLLELLIAAKNYKQKNTIGTQKDFSDSKTNFYQKYFEDKWPINLVPGSGKTLTLRNIRGTPFKMETDSGSK